jgi:hypothetical protein
MKTEAGLWIDRREAVIVMVADGEKETRRIEADLGRHVRFTGGHGARTPFGTQPAEDKRERQNEDRVNRYYSEVIASLRDADKILIFGPGEAKTEVQRLLEREGLGRRVVAVEPADKMTERQITAKVRQAFPA